MTEFIITDEDRAMFGDNSPTVGEKDPFAPEAQPAAEPDPTLTERLMTSLRGDLGPEARAAAAATRSGVPESARIGLTQFIKGRSGGAAMPVGAAAGAAMSYVPGVSNMLGVDPAEFEGKDFTERYSGILDSYEQNNVGGNAAETNPGAYYGGLLAGSATGAPMKLAKHMLAPDSATKLNKALNLFGIGAAEGAMFSGTEQLGKLPTGEASLADFALDTALGAGGSLVFSPAAWAGSKFTNWLNNTETAKTLKEMLARPAGKGTALSEMVTSNADNFLEEGPAALPAFADTVGRMDLSNEATALKFRELSDAVDTDIEKATQELITTANKVTPAEGAVEYGEKLDARLEQNRAAYTDMITAAEDIPSGDIEDIIGVISKPYQRSDGTAHVLTPGQEKVYSSMIDDLGRMQAQAEEQGLKDIPLSALIKWRKATAEKLGPGGHDESRLNSDEFSDVKSAFKGLDKLIDERLGATASGKHAFTEINQSYTDMFNQQEAFTAGLKMYGNKPMHQVLDWLKANPEYTKDFRNGLRQAMSDNMNTNVRSGLRKLFGDAEDPLKINENNYKKLAVVLGNDQAAALKAVYESSSPKLAVLKDAKKALTDKAGRPPMTKVNVDPGGSPDAATTLHGLLTGGPMALTASPGRSRSTFKALGADEPDSLLSDTETQAAMDLLGASGPAYAQQSEDIFAASDPLRTRALAGVLSGTASATGDSEATATETAEDVFDWFEGD